MRLPTPSACRPSGRISHKAAVPLHALALICLFLLASSPARAGTYVATYSGGGVTASPGYYSASYTDSYGGYGGGHTSFGGSGISSVQCSGQITATLTWTPTQGQSLQTDPPPAAAIVTQTSSASWDGTAYDSSGQCDNGLGSPVQTTNNGYSQSCSGSAYTAGGGATITLTCTPSASASAGPQCCEAEAFASYTASATPVTVTLSGTTLVNGAQEALCGQQITPQLSGIPSACAVQSWTWSFTNATGSNPFKNYDPTNNTQQFFPLTSADLTGAATPQNPSPTVNSPGFYDDDGNTVTVKCALVIQPPTPSGGTTPPTIAVTAQSQPVEFQKATAAWTVDTIPPYLSNQFKGLYVTPNTNFGAEEWWDPINITVPSGFSGGTGGLAQIGTFSRKNTRIATGTGANTYFNKIESPPGSGNWVAPGPGLDGSFPYPFGYADSGGQDGTLVTGGYTWDVSVLGHSTDVTKHAFVQPDVDSGGTQWTYAYASDSFNTWLMYRPPGGIWVPLQMLTWSWGADANINPLPPAPNGTWTAENGSFVPGSPTPTEAYPAWTTVIPGITMRP